MLVRKPIERGMPATAVKRIAARCMTPGSLALPLRIDPRVVFVHTVPNKSPAVAPSGAMAARFGRCSNADFSSLASHNSMARRISLAFVGVPLLPGDGAELGAEGGAAEAEDFGGARLEAADFLHHVG